jgi:hypothetical protein
MQASTSSADALSARAGGSCRRPWASSEDVRHFLRRCTETAASGSASARDRRRSAAVPAIPIASVTRPHRPLIVCCHPDSADADDDWWATGRWAESGPTKGRASRLRARGSGRKLPRRVGVRTATHPTSVQRRGSEDDASCHLRLRRGPRSRRPSQLRRPPHVRTASCPAKL